VSPFAAAAAGAGADTTPARRGTDTAHRPGVETAALPRDLAAAGDTLFQTYCAVCHGLAADGRGTVGVLIAAPSLLSARARAYSDGYLYSIIRYGRGTMPRYGDKVYAPNDRWAIVNHLRKLQAATPAPPGDPRLAAPIQPGASMTGSTGAYPQ
jgi:mono/diheme cytochrome c family protein